MLNGICSSTLLTCKVTLLKVQLEECERQWNKALAENAHLHQKVSCSCQVHIGFVLLPYCSDGAAVSIPIMMLSAPKGLMMSVIFLNANILSCLTAYLLF